MAWIKVFDPKAAGGLLKRLIAPFYDEGAKQVDNILMIHSLNPNGLRAHLGLYKHAMAEDEFLSKADREMIAVVTSSENQCHY